ncbi:MAG: prepilin peptidase [Candidatus Aminicenantales bacterium]|jgi:leader peptidase (prepilin peptidase)/N-methyltransferase
METMIFIVLFGLAWGSFLNVVIYRLPLGLNLAHPPSACPDCGTPIRPWDNIPVLSYLFLRGRCRKCGQRIPFRYVLVELLTPALLVVLSFEYGLTPHFFAAAVFTSALIALAFIDFNHKILPDKITFPIAGLGLGYAFFRTDLSPLQALLGAAAGGGVLLLLYGGYYLVRKKEGLGLGDVTMMIMVGVFLGWGKALLTIILGSFAGAIVGVVVIAARKKDLQFALPFGTFLAPAAFVALVWGDRLISAYLRIYPGH